MRQSLVINLYKHNFKLVFRKSLNVFKVKDFVSCWNREIYVRTKILSQGGA